LSEKKKIITQSGRGGTKHVTAAGASRGTNGPGTAQETGLWRV
jgi:hypothetical protein